MSDTHPTPLETVAQQAKGAMALHAAYVGVANGLFDTLEGLDRADPATLAAEAGVDADYAARWADAAYAFGYLDTDGQGAFGLTDTGTLFTHHGGGAPFAIQGALTAHLADRAAECMPSGEQPGESVFGERPTLGPLFGPMLEGMFAPFFEREILPTLAIYREMDEREGLVVDLGCGNGWYLRRMAQRYPHLRGLGLDPGERAAEQARELATADNVGDRLDFRVGDIDHFPTNEPVDLIALNRALHHLWGETDDVFGRLYRHLRPGGGVVVWEPNWPAHREALRQPRRQGMALQNLMEHVQGNHFLRPDEIVGAMEAAGFSAEVHTFAEDSEAVVVGRRPE